MNIDPQLRASPPKPRDSFPNGVPPTTYSHSPMQPSPNNSYHSINTPTYYQNPPAQDTPEDLSTSPNPQDPSDPNDPNDLKRPRACEACRQLKVKCEPDDSHPQGSCKRCAKANRQCIVTAPSRKRQKKTDGRVAELEKKIDALTATLAARGGTDPDLTLDPSVGHPQHTPLPRPSSFAEQWHPPPAPHPPPGPMNVRSPPPMLPHQQGLKRKVANEYEYFGGELHKSGVPVFKSAPPPNHYPSPAYQEPIRPKADSEDWAAFDVIDRGLIDLNPARKIFERYVAEMCDHLPLVVFPPNTSADDIRRHKPMLFATIVAIASGTIRADLQPKLINEITRVLADRVMYRGEKSLELVQSIQVLSCFYQPPERYEELNFNQLIHVAAVMAMDLGMGKRAKRHAGGIWRPYHENKKPLTDPNNAETRRCWLGCYYMCCNSSMSLRRPLLIRWSPYADECVEVLTTSKDALPSDKWFCQLVRAQHIAEDVGLEFSMDDPASLLTLNDSKTQYHLKAFERLLKEWYDAASPEILSKPLFKHSHGIINLYMHEIAMHHNHNIDDFRPPFNATPIEGPPDPDNVTPAHIEALTTCIESAHATFDAFLSMDIRTLRAIPTLFFVRNAYAAVALIKMYSAVSAKGSKFGAIFKTQDLRVDYYLDRLNEILSRTAEGGNSRVAQKFSLIFNMLRSWHLKRTEDGPVSRQRTPAGRGNAQQAYRPAPLPQEPPPMSWNQHPRPLMDQPTAPHVQPRNGLQMLSDAAMGPGPPPSTVLGPQPPQHPQWLPQQPIGQMLPGVTEMSMHNPGMMGYGLPGQELGPMDFTSDELMAFGFGDEFLAMNFGFEQPNWAI